MVATRIKKALILLAVFGLPVLIVIGLLWPHVRTYEDGPLATVRWMKGADSRHVICIVTDNLGAPLSDVVVEVDNHSGGDAELTDKSGIARFRMGESDVEGLAINHHVIVDRPYAFFLNTPSVDEGLVFLVVVKDLEKLRRTQ